ncbi:MAG TPA: MBL fold metallo-hydrolase [Thermomicrobiales bacterium]|nr:MBL fold metallo-hydrolase [Thermomicrobiales bacterium]
MSIDTNVMTTETLRAMIERDEPLTILDVRPADERAEWSIPGSLHVDAYERLKAGDRHVLDTVDLPTSQPVVTVCAAGRTSQIAADLLRERGMNAISLAGGMKSWSLAWNTARVDVPGSAALVIQLRRTGKGCLSYMVGSGGEALVIDASLDPDVYMQLAAEHDWTITTVLDTHVHADHLSRSRLLAERAGATLYMPRQDRVHYPFQPLRDGDTLAVGEATLRVIATPGHTNESTTYQLDGQALFTGDTLFLAGVGRPDLEATADESRQRAATLHDSLQRLLQLPPGSIVLPGHVSEPIPFDGQPLSAPLSSVRERVSLLHETRDGFVSAILGRIPPTPPNHHLIVEANEAGLLPDGDVTDLEAGANRCAVS